MDNYARLAETWRKKFLTLNQDAHIAALSLPHDQKSIFFSYYGRQYRVDRQTGGIFRGDTLAPVGDRLNLYTLFWYRTPNARNSGVYVPFCDVPGGSPYDGAYQRTVIAHFRRAFTGRTGQLRLAGQALGAVWLPQGDVGFTLEAFPGIPVQFYFWDADEEFPAGCNILFDRNITQFVHVESVVSIAADGITALEEAAEQL